MSWKPEVVTDSTGTWYGNQLRFATREEAEANVAALKERWTKVIATRVVESDEPANYKVENGRLVHIEPEPMVIDVAQDELDHKSPNWLSKEGRKE